ncbi:MAG TPA: polysaccharide biosynthesis/export family protein [Phycisphaerae bacterium]|nr:polysaccharide biosynthesis/export family protein [Phycisphaerae bacterium]
MRYRAKLLGTVVLLLPCVGCANRHEDLLKFLKDHEHGVTATEYRVGIPDSIGISSPRILEIDNANQTVGVDGKISLRLLGPVRVVGLTPKEIAVKLQELLEPFYQDPKVHVEVTDYASKKYYVFGEVSGEGPYAYTGKDSVADALSQARPTFIAWRSEVRVIRPHPDPDEVVKLRVDLERMMRTGDMRMNVLLEPGDIVYVPPTPLGWLGQRVQEVLYPFMPVYQAYQFPANFLQAQDQYEDRE